MPRPIQATIHTAALAHNLQRCRRAAGDAHIWAVIKANAYGHGIERAYHGLRAADGFALLDMDEATRLRQLGWRGPILLIEGVFEPRDLEICSRLNLWHVVHDDAHIDMLAAHKTTQPHTVFLKVNTGMARLGFQPASVRTAYARLQALPQVDSIGLMTHFAQADVSTPGIDAAWHSFQSTTGDLSGARSVCNSAALLRHPHIATHTDWVRPGIVLYGSSPDHAPNTPDSHSAADWGLLPAMSLRSRLLATRTLQTGDSVGYGALYTAPAPTRVGIVACGYADGYPRTAPTGTPVLVDGIRTRTLGRISMDMLIVDLEPVAAAGGHITAGSEVTLWGMASNGTILPIDDVAHAAGTLGYELMCALAARVPVSADDTAIAAA